MTKRIEQGSFIEKINYVLDNTGHYVISLVKHIVVPSNRRPKLDRSTRGIAGVEGKIQPTTPKSKPTTRITR